MDATLAQLMTELFTASQQVQQAVPQIRQLSARVDQLSKFILENKLEVPEAPPPPKPQVPAEVQEANRKEGVAQVQRKKRRNRK